MSKCPKCEAIVSNVNINDVPVHVNYQPIWKGISYVCPHCQTILGIQIDPVALKTDLINEILEALKK